MFKHRTTRGHTTGDGAGAFGVDEILMPHLLEALENMFNLGTDSKGDDKSILSFASIPT